MGGKISNAGGSNAVRPLKAARHTHRKFMQNPCWHTQFATHCVVPLCVFSACFSASYLTLFQCNASDFLSPQRRLLGYAANLNMACGRMMISHLKRAKTEIHTNMSIHFPSYLGH